MDSRPSAAFADIHTRRHTQRARTSRPAQHIGNRGRCRRATWNRGPSRGLARTAAALARADERRRLARDLHDGVQNELLSLMLRLKLAEEDRTTQPALAATFVALEDHARGGARVAARNRLRDLPLALAKLGLAKALRAQAARAPIKVHIAGTTPRSTDEAEAAVYLCCCEAIQNVAKHAGRSLTSQARLAAPPRGARRADRRRRSGV